VKKQHRIITGVAIIAVIFLIAFTSMSQFISPYRYVYEVKGNSKYMKEDVYVAGLIVQGTFKQVSSNPRTYEFMLTDGKESMKVLYRGDLPAAFDTSQGCVVYGHFTEDGTFQAVKLLAKCPSKYRERIVERMNE